MINSKGSSLGDYPTGWKTPRPPKRTGGGTKNDPKPF